MRTIIYKSKNQLVDAMNRLSTERISFRIATSLTLKDTFPAILLALVKGDFPSMYAKRYQFDQKTDPQGFIVIDAIYQGTLQDEIDDDDW